MVKVKISEKSNSNQLKDLPKATLNLDIDQELDIKTREIFREIKNQIISFHESNLDKNNQINLEVADLVNLVEQVQYYKIPHEVESLEIATELLLKSQDIKAFKIISKNLHERLEKYETCFHKIIHFFRVILRSWSPPNKLIFGLLFALYVTYLPILFCLMWLIEIMSGLKTTMMLLAGIGGGCGSVISTLLRIRELQFSPKEDLLIPLFTGFFKPAIGTVFGIFFFCLIESNIVQGPINIKFPEQNGNQQKEYAVLASSFIAGFSERFTRDIIGRFNTSKKD